MGNIIFGDTYIYSVCEYAQVYLFVSTLIVHFISYRVEHHSSTNADCSPSVSLHACGDGVLMCVVLVCVDQTQQFSGVKHCVHSLNKYIFLCVWFGSAVHSKALVLVSLFTPKVS